MDTMDSEMADLKENVSKEHKTGKLNNNEGRSSWFNGFSELGVIGLIDLDDLSNSDSTSGLNASPHRSPLRSIDVLSGQSPDAAFVQDFKRVKRCSDVSGRSRKNYFEKLSDEVIISIFSLLPKHVLATLSLVCKRFRCLCLDESLWTRFDLSFKTLPQHTLGYVLSRGIKALRLNSSSVTSPVFDPAQPFKDSYRFKVLYLDLSVVHISVKDLESVLRHCNSLRKLSVEACALSDEVCHYIGQNKNLDTLDMAMCSNLSCIGINNIVANCKRLENVNIAWCNLTPDAISAFCYEVSPSLVSLNLSGALRSLSNEDLEVLAERCPDLTELDISDCTKITGQVIENLANCLENLQKLSISRSFKIPASKLLQLKGKASLCMLNVFGNSHGSMFSSDVMKYVKSALPGVAINSEMMSPIARPTVGIRRTSIWEIRCRD